MYTVCLKITPSVSNFSLPLHAERSEAGLASFFAAKPPPLCLPYWGRLFLCFAALRSFDSVLIFSDKPFFNTRRFSPLRMTKCAASFLNPLNPLPLCHFQLRDGTPRELNCYQETFGHRPIYICGEAATITLNPAS